MQPAATQPAALPVCARVRSLEKPETLASGQVLGAMCHLLALVLARVPNAVLRAKFGAGSALLCGIVEAKQVGWGGLGGRGDGVAVGRVQGRPGQPGRMRLWRSTLIASCTQRAATPRLDASPACPPEPNRRMALW